jgi:hypothetical protein
VKQSVYFQRIEASILFLASLYFYLHLGYKWYWFVIFLFSVDVFMLGYLTKSNKIGAYAYNLGHSLILPLCLVILGTVIKSDLLTGAGLIWFGHVGWDRAFGYGLKYESSFNDTHLGKIGKK